MIKSYDKINSYFDIIPLFKYKKLKAFSYNKTKSRISQIKYYLE